MAIRTIREKGDSILNKKCREVTDFGPRLHELLEDMRDTLRKAGGVGLAAPQVGVLRRAFVVVEGTGDEGPDGEEYAGEAGQGEERIIEFVNPEIVDTSGEQTGPEGCLSVPGTYGVVTRPERVKVRARDRNGKPFEYEGEGLVARALCHESDHLEGRLFLELVQRMLSPEELMGDDQEEETGDEEE